MPSRLTRDGSLNLCQRCKELNSGCDFKPPGLFQSEELYVNLGILDEDSPCTLCRIYYSMRRPSVTGKTTDIYCLHRCNLKEPIRSIEPPRFWEIITSIVWTVDPDSRPLDWERDGDRRLYQHISTRPQLLLISQSTKSFLHPEASQETLKGLPVYETSVNYPLLRYWIKECEGHLDCSDLSTDYTNPRTRPVIRGIDCNSRRIDWEWIYLDYRNNCATVKVEDADGILLSISDLVELFGAEVERSRLLPERTTYLWLEGFVLTLGFQPFGNRHGGDICFCFNHPLGCSDYLTGGSCALDSEDNEVSFRMNVRGSEEIWRTTPAKKWNCLRIYSYNGGHHFLILDEGDDAAYCVGTLLIQYNTEDENLLEKLKTKVPHEYKKVRIG